MTEHISNQPALTEQEKLRAVVAQYDPQEKAKFESPFDKFKRAKEKALRRLPNITGMSITAINATYPNLIKHVHYEELTYTNSNGEICNEPAFTLWTSHGHALTANGEIIAHNGDGETLVTIDKPQLLNPPAGQETIDILEKKISSLLRKIIIRDEFGSFKEEAISDKNPYVD